MRRFVELSGDIPRPIKGDRCVEIESLLYVFPGRIVRCTERYAIVETEHIREISGRLAMAHYVYRYLGRPGEASLDGEFLVHRVRLGGPRISAKEALEIVRSAGASTDLSAGEEIFVISAPDGIHLASERIPTGRRFLAARSPANRPVHEPPTLDPYTARFLVNLSRVPPGEYLLDPFCGYGAILMEAFDVSARPVGIDLRVRALSGTIKNFEHFFGTRPDLILGDSSNPPVSGIKYVATDPPRGRMLKRIEPRYKFLENTDAKIVAAVLGRLHDVGDPRYLGVRNEGKKKELRFAVYELR